MAFIIHIPTRSDGEVNKKHKLMACDGQHASN